MHTALSVVCYTTVFSRFSVVTQLSSSQTAAEIRTTFLSALCLWSNEQTNNV